MRGVAILFVMISSIFAQQSKDARTWLDQGIAAYKETRYGDALYALQKAVEMIPGAADGHLYLGLTYMTLCIPTWNSRGKFADDAESEFKRAIEIDSGNSIAMESLALLVYNKATALNGDERITKLHDARDQYRRVLTADSQNKEAHYMLGVIAWTESYPADMTARAQLGRKPEDPGPLPASVREQLTTRYAALIETGITELERALAIDPAYKDAMAYMNLLIRERGDLRDSAEEAQRDAAAADQWRQKAAAEKDAPSSGRCPQICTPPPPPPPSRLRAPGNVRASRLIHQTGPSCPAAIQQRIESTLKFSAIVSENGHVVRVYYVSGAPLLIQAAMDAIRNWTYTPTLINEKPIEVILPIEVKMSCGI